MARPARCLWLLQRPMFLCSSGTSPPYWLVFDSEWLWCYIPSCEEGQLLKLVSCGLARKHCPQLSGSAGTRSGAEVGEQLLLWVGPWGEGLFWGLRVCSCEQMSAF